MKEERGTTHREDPGIQPSTPREEVRKGWDTLPAGAIEPTPPPPQGEPPPMPPTSNDASSGADYE